MITTYYDAINKFHECVDDGSRLSTTQELALAYLVVNNIYDAFDWTFSQKKFNGTISNGKIAMPEDFINFIRTSYNGRDRLLVFINSQPYDVISYSQTQEVYGRGVYIDPQTDELVTNANGTITYFYKAQPVEPTVLNYQSTDLPMPPRFGDVVAYGMAALFYPIDSTEPGASQMNIYTELYNQKLLAMKARDIKNQISSVN